jgi:hypothetical protein
VLFALLGRWYRVRTRYEDVVRRGALESFCPGILGAFDDIERTTGKSGPYVAKCWELLRLLRRHRPTFIMEMGSGRTSLVFAAYAAQTGATYVGFEQDEHWQSLVNRLIGRLCHTTPVQRVDVEVVDYGGRYTAPIRAGVDFVYVDGPFTPGLSFPTFCGKAAAMDVPAHLAAGHRPQVIVVDERTDTVDQIRRFAGYHFAGGWLWAQERRVIRHGLNPRRHSVFVATTTDVR